MNKTYTREDVVRILSKRLGFTNKDMRLIFNELEKFVAELVTERDKLEFRGIFSIDYGKLSARKMKNPKTLEVTEYPECERLLFTPSVVLRDILRPEGSKHIKKKIEYEE